MRLCDTNSIFYLIEIDELEKVLEKHSERLKITPELFREIIKLIERKLSGGHFASDFIPKVNVQKNYLIKKKSDAELKESDSHPTSGVNFVKECKLHHKGGDVSILCHVLEDPRIVNEIITSDHPLIKAIVSQSMGHKYVIELLFENSLFEEIDSSKIRSLFELSMGQYDLSIEEFKKKYDNMGYYSRYNKVKKRVDSIDPFTGAVLLADG